MQESGTSASDAAYGRGALFVRRPVLALVLSLLVVVAGLAALSGVEVRELPNTDRPIVSIRTSYTGAPAEIIDKEITAVIEGAIARTPGIVDISSTSSSGNSRITVEFAENVDVDLAANDLREAVSNVIRRLPEDAGTPTIVKADSDAQAVIQLAAMSATMKIEDLTTVVEDNVVARLATVEGVAEVTVQGAREPVVRIIIDPYALSVRGLTIGDLQNALGDIALDTPAGTFSDLNRSLLVRANASITEPAQIATIRINATTTVGDVADILYGPAERTQTLKVNGQTAIGLGIVRQANSNTLAISEGIAHAVEDLNATLPGDVTVKVTSDDGTFIEGALHEVVLTLLLATGIVVAIIWLFLRSVPITLIPAVTVPVTLLGTVAAIWLSGFSINLITLLALVLATGLVVDDAIIVIENISRRRAMGLGPRAAAVLGTRQVFFAVIATTATLAAVFIPVSFMPGTAGALFKEFGFVLAFAVALSSVIALTLSPMLASRLIGVGADRPRTVFGRVVAAFGRGLNRVYLRVLDAALAAPLVVLVLAGLFAGGAAVVYTTLPEELTPAEDRGTVGVFLSAPQGATALYMEAQAAAIEPVLSRYIDSGEATDLFVSAGSNGGFMNLTLAPWGERQRSQAAISAEVSARLATIAGVNASVRGSNGLGIRGGGQGLSFVLLGYEYDELADIGLKLVAAMEDDPAVFSNPSMSYNTTQAQLAMQIDRERAADLGVPLANVSAIVQSLLDGRSVGEFYIGDNAIPVSAAIPTGMIQDFSGLDNIQIRSQAGEMVPLSSLVSWEEVAVAPNLPRANQRRAVNLSSQMAEGVDLRTAMARLLEIAGTVVPETVSVAFTGEAERLNETANSIWMIFGFALLVVLLVLAAQFESFNSGIILMATVPFGIASAVYAMALSGTSLNIYSQIGLVMLVGLMAKNGILIVEFANQLREEGQSVRAAIRNACEIRVRPLIMTMLATVLGGLPLVLSAGAGAESRHALGWVVVGGLGFATISTLFLTPVVYQLLAGFSKPRTAEEQRLLKELAAADGTPAPRPVVRVLKPVEDDLPVAAE